MRFLCQSRYEYLISHILNIDSNLTATTNDSMRSNGSHKKVTINEFMEVIYVNSFKQFNYENSYNLDYIEYRQHKMLKKQLQHDNNNEDTIFEQTKEKCFDCALI